jgi:hypothetical protein
MTIEQIKEKIDQYMQDADREGPDKMNFAFYEGKAFAYAVCLNLLEYYIEEDKSQ